MIIDAIVVAAGTAQRFGGTIPKQYCELAGEPVLQRTLQRLAMCTVVRRLCVVIHEDHEELYRRWITEPPATFRVFGGTTRQASVHQGLEALGRSSPPDAVLIHDGARPMISEALVTRITEALHAHKAVLPVVPVTDSVKRVRQGIVEAEVERTNLVGAQTPQAFAFAEILNAHRLEAAQSFTDDTALARAAGLEIFTVPGDPNNVKITRSDDLDAMEASMNRDLDGRNWRWRTGMGYDVHRLVPDRRLMLGGIEIPFEYGLDGHSDADVVLHALTDALLGTISAGDIGSHFPPSEAQWRDADSALFLEHARELIERQGGEIEHVDLTIIGEKPKVGPYRQAMIQRIADILGISTSEVSVKATTTEGLGFTGRGEGIAAQAAATVRLSAGDAPR